MKRWLIGVGCLVVFAVGVSSYYWSRSSPAKNDAFQPFQGAWDIVSLDEAGKKIEGAMLKDRKVGIYEDRFQLFASKSDNFAVLEDVVIRVDSSKTPNEINFVYLEGKKQGQAKLGIYAFEEKRLRLCVANIGKARPTELVAKPGESILMVLQRK